MKWYGEPLDAFAAGNLDARESACAASLRDIREKNYAAFKRIWEVLPKSAPGTSLGVVIGDSKTWLDAYRASFDFSHVTMIAQALVGSHSVCVWEANAKSGAVRRAFIVRGGGQGPATVSAVTSATVIEEMILNSMEAARRNPAAYKPVSGLRLRYQYEIPSEGKGNFGEHPVSLQFDGMPLDFDLTQAQIPAPSPVVEFYRRAYSAYGSNDFDAFAGMLTPQSEAQLRQWLATQKGKKPSVPSLVGQRYVKFVMNGDPIFLVFSSQHKGKTRTPVPATYRYVVREPASGTYALANLDYGNALDEFLNSGLFDARKATTDNAAAPAP